MFWTRPVDGAWLTEAAARFLIALLYIQTGVVHIRSKRLTAMRIDQITARGVPLAAPVLYTGYAVQMVGALMILADWHSAGAAYMLVGFTAAATWLFHPAWIFAEGDARRQQWARVAGNCGIMGGLLALALV